MILFQLASHTMLLLSFQVLYILILSYLSIVIMMSHVITHCYLFAIIIVIIIIKYSLPHGLKIRLDGTSSFIIAPTRKDVLHPIMAP